MALMIWSQKLSVGVERFDREHKVLVEMLNGLHDGMLRGEAKNILGPLLRKLVQYTQTHFADEEAMFKEHHYPSALSHTLEHDKLRKKVEALAQAYEEGKAGLTVETSKFLKEWLTSHILETDMQYKTHFQAKGLK
jgi:hemerythrin-like metal-binding protein